MVISFLYHYYRSKLTYVGKWGHTWSKMDECGERWNGQNNFLILFNIIFLCFVQLV